MIIPTAAIKDWKDLQNKTAKFFMEMGYYTETPKTISLVRGQAEVDVYIRDDRASVNQQMLVECKHWRARVSQHEVHALHTVMQDSGANTGFIVTKIGFQRGAKEAAELTNIHLLTWERLQHTFGNQWLAHQDGVLEPIIAEMRGIDSSHLDQFETPKSIMNNMRYSGDDREKLLNVLSDMRVAQFAAMSRPRTYDQVGPICVSVSEEFLSSEKDAYGNHELKLADVRAYYEWLIPWSMSLITQYRALSNQAHKRFNDLPDEAQESLFNKALMEIRGETPIRAFRKLLGESTYLSLIENLHKKSLSDCSLSEAGADKWPNSGSDQ